MSGACHMDSDGRSAVWLLVWKRSVASGRVFRPGSGMDMLLGSRTATPWCSFAVARFVAHAEWPSLFSGVG